MSRKSRRESQSYVPDERAGSTRGLDLTKMRRARTAASNDAPTSVARSATQSGEGH